MPRSLKKGPYVEESLLKKVERHTKIGDRQAIKTGAAALPLFLIL